jgi:CRISPR/Cas system-associated endonuclease Cas1
MVQVFYTDGYVDKHKSGSRFCKTPRKARSFAKSFVTGKTANQDIYMTRYYSVDEDGVESCETFKNVENVVF